MKDNCSKIFSFYKNRPAQELTKENPSFESPLSGIPLGGPPGLESI